MWHGQPRPWFLPFFHPDVERCHTAPCKDKARAPPSPSMAVSYKDAIGLGIDIGFAIENEMGLGASALLV